MSAAIQAMKRPRSALRAITAAQEQFKADLDIDSNCDGIGEYGYFAELAGAQAMRIAVPVGGGEPCVPGAGSVFTDKLDPPLLRSPFAHMALPSNPGRIALHGYYFQMWLPDHDVLGKVRGVAEDVPGGKRRLLPQSRQRRSDVVLPTRGRSTSAIRPAGLFHQPTRSRAGRPQPHPRALLRLARAAAIRLGVRRPDRQVRRSGSGMRGWTAAFGSPCLVRDSVAPSFQNSDRLSEPDGQFNLPLSISRSIGSLADAVALVNRSGRDDFVVNLGRQARTPRNSTFEDEA